MKYIFATILAVVMLVGCSGPKQEPAARSSNLVPEETADTSNDMSGVAAAVSPAPDQPSLFNRISRAVGLGPECPGGFRHKDLPSGVTVPPDDPRLVEAWRRWREITPCEEKALGYFPDYNRFWNGRYYKRAFPDFVSAPEVWADGKAPPEVLLNSDVYWLVKDGIARCQIGEEDCATMTLNDTHPAKAVGSVKIEMQRWFFHNCPRQKIHMTWPDNPSNTLPVGYRYLCK